MAELAVLSVMWLAFLVFAAGKGTARLRKPYVGVLLPVAAGVFAAVLEALPLEPYSPGFTLRTLIAVVAGVFLGRLIGRVTAVWAAGHEKRAVAQAPAKPPRLIHPLIAVGLFAAGIPVLWYVIASNYSLLEEVLTPRDEKTGIVHGCEEVRLPRAPAADTRGAVLLLHGLYSSPPDFADLPQRLHAAGFAVFAPLLPGHGRRPDDLDKVWAADYRKAVQSAYDELAAQHERVSVVGGSAGATLAILVAAERKPAAVVLVSPYLGHLATPSWCPFEFDSLVGPLSRLTRRMVVSQDMRGRMYATQSLHALRQMRDLARGVDAATAKIKCPVFVLLGGRDELVEPEWTIAWVASRLPGMTFQLMLDSGHDVYHEVAREQALGITVRWFDALPR